ncbi:dihydrofolate reductase [Demequina sp.]|uniref:dihydrofolate reductase n=1 Tax=Demequina sp. TaxID=2050685 RepID=UPI0025E6F3C2|nr:dihydrofolate reductase [Demequina sp.]
MTVRAIWAQARDDEGRSVIGLDGTMPWNLPEDLARFQQLTAGGVVIMGRRTWESLPPRFRPLPRRTNVVVSRHENTFPGAASASSLSAALDVAEELDPDVTCWVIGGSGLLAEAMTIADVLQVTEIDLEVAGDTYAPPVDARRWSADAGEWATSRTGLRHRFVTYHRVA